MTEALLNATILDLDTLYPHDLDRQCLQNLPLHWQHYSYTRVEQVVSRLANSAVVLTNKVALTEDILKQVPKIRYIGVLATGVDHIDLDYAQGQGIVVNNVNNYCNYSVAQYTLSLMLTLATDQYRYLQAVQQGQWCSGRSFSLLQGSMMELYGKKLLLVGYGNLGKAVAKLAQALGMRVLLANIPGAPQQYSERLSWHEGLSCADIVSLHCPLTENTRYLINHDSLSLMQRHSFLINTARGDLIDNQALLEALKSKQIAGAAVDVLEVEPPPADHPLLNRTNLNLLVSPHVAWGTREARQNLLEQAAEHIQSWLLRR